MSSVHHPATRSSQQLYFHSQLTFANGWKNQKLQRRLPCSLAAASGEPEKPRSTCRDQIRRRSSAFSGTGRRVNSLPALRRPQPLSRVRRKRRARHRTRSSSVVYRRTSELTSQFKFVSSSFQRNNSIIMTVNGRFWLIASGNYCVQTRTNIPGILLCAKTHSAGIWEWP